MSKLLMQQWKLQQTVQVLLLVSTITGVGAIAGFSYYEARHALKASSAEHLRSIQKTRKRNVEDYLGTIRDQIITFSSGLTVRHGMRDFSRAFAEIPADSLAETTLSDMKTGVENYYASEFLPRLNQNLKEKTGYRQLLPPTSREIWLQHHYIVANTHPTGEKDKLQQATDTSRYSQYHQQYHAVIRQFLKKFGYYDIFLVNLQGDIIYSVFKEIDFGTNLLTGPYRDTNFATAFRKARAADNPDQIFLEDFERYTPSYSAPASFIASPVFEQGEKTGVLIFQMPVDKVNNILTGAEEWQNNGLGKTGEVYLAGADLLMRTNSRFLIEDGEKFYQKLLLQGTDSSLAGHMLGLGTSILMQPVNSQIVAQAIASGEAEIESTNYLGQQVIASASHLTFAGLQWAIISEITTSEVYAPIARLRDYILLLSLGILALVSASGIFFTNALTRPLKILQQKLLQLSTGMLPQVAPGKGSNEIASIQQAAFDLVQTQRQIATFAENIGKGNLATDFTPRGEHDVLGNSLLQMRNDLQELKEEEQKSAWISENMAGLAQLMREHQSLNELCTAASSSLANLLKAQQVWVFICNNTGNETRIDLQACFAWDRQKYLKKSLYPGEGLTGQVYLEKKKIYLTELPPGYAEIRSGMGSSAPACLLVLPVILNEKVEALLEISSLSLIQDHELQLLERFAASFAASVASIKTNEHTRKLYETSRQAEAELRQKEEIMRQNNEEMLATQEEFTRKEKMYQARIAELEKQTTQSAGKV